jgi:hypothetical protein
VHIRNFGRNETFRPRDREVPRDEDELLAAMRRHAGRRIRCVGSLHSWSAVLSAPDVCIDMRRFAHVRQAGPEVTSIGAGCTIGRAVTALRSTGHALPAIGAVTKQTVAGAISTGTHGSGAHSLSHYVEGVRIATYDERSGEPVLREISGGDALLAARCGLGRTGVVTDVRLRTRALWNVEERLARRGSIEEVLDDFATWPLQLSLLDPFGGGWISFLRRETAEPVPRHAVAYLAYTRAWIDVTLHAALRAILVRPTPAVIARCFVERALPSSLIYGWRTVGRYDTILTLRHDIFRHEEMELLVPENRVADATAVVRFVLAHCAGLAPRLPAAPLEKARDLVHDSGLDVALREATGCYSHHYPVLFRRVLQDDTLLSMSSGGSGPWQALSFFCYLPRRQRAGFYRMAALLARVLHRTAGARPHWGKHFPLSGAEIRPSYGGLGRFRDACRDLDPAGAFGNPFTEEKLGF